MTKVLPKWRGTFHRIVRYRNANGLFRVRYEPIGHDPKGCELCEYERF